MARKLIDMDVRRVALVDKAANLRDFLLFKRKDNTMEDKDKGLPMEAIVASMPEEVKAVVKDKLGGLYGAVTEIVKLMGFAGQVEAVQAAVNAEADAELTKQLAERDAQIVDLEAMVTELSKAVETLSADVVTEEDVTKMLETITGKKPVEKKAGKGENENKDGEGEGENEED